MASLCGSSIFPPLRGACKLAGQTQLLTLAPVSRSGGVRPARLEPDGIPMATATLPAIVRGTPFACDAGISSMVAMEHQTGPAILAVTTQGPLLGVVASIPAPRHR